MPAWLRQLTYLLATGCAAAATAVPAPYVSVMLIAAAFLGGLATTHPSDAINGNVTTPKATPAAVANLEAQLQAQVTAEKEPATPKASLAIVTNLQAQLASKKAQLEGMK